MFYRKNSDKKGIVSTLINRAAVYDNLKFFDKALIDQKEAIELARILKDTYLEAMAMSNNALVVWHTGDADKAIKILNRVLEMSTESDGDIEILNTLWILSEIYSSKREYAVSNEKLLELLKQYQGKDDKRGEAKVLTSLGRNLIELNEIDKALGYLNKSLEITIEIDASFEKLENYRNLVHVNAILHNLKTSDSLQDLFAETYSYLFKTDSIAISRIDYENSNQSVVSNRISFADWLTAFLLLIIMLILSVLVYKK
jgi:tetratricopeptide (TPR) repeat protein